MVRYNHTLAMEMALERLNSLPTAVGAGAETAVGLLRSITLGTGDGGVLQALPANSAELFAAAEQCLAARPRPR